ncbi:hypothetical protein CBR_g34555 [Chara braunii]|uniref:Reverse transcriptase domain-containing protein n=1 Tax=Chara braunii TaxID=69332 RepID=A0A388LJ42_CHABU|nr:hypothetical protein CBR_g34555 [Chara braunii]|eukprot:GBG82271.1 hypothetical protein CBR_g34555 [Chara braunii]
MCSSFSVAPSSSRPAATSQSRGTTRGRSSFAGRFRRQARHGAPFSRHYNSLEYGEDASTELDPTVGDAPEDIELRDVIQYHLDDDTVPVAERLQIAMPAMGRARSRVAQAGTRTPTVPQIDLPQGFVLPRGALSPEERAALEARRGCLRCRLDGYTSSRCPYHTALDRHYADISRERRYQSPRPRPASPTHLAMVQCALEASHVADFPITESRFAPLATPPKNPQDMTDAVLSAPSSVEVSSASQQTAASSASPPRLPTRRAIRTARCSAQLATRDDFASSLLDLSILQARQERLTRHINGLRRLLALLSDHDRTLPIIPIRLGTSTRVYHALWDSGSQGDFVHPRVVEEARLATSVSRSPTSVTLGDNKTQRFFDQTVPDLHFSLTLQPSDSTQTPRRYHSSAYFDVLETGYDFILGTPWSRRFRGTEAEWATETLVLKMKCGETHRISLIGTTGDTPPDLPPQDPRPSGSHPDIAFTSPRQFAHFIRQEDVTFYSVNIIDLRYDPLCPEVELISLEPDPPDPPPIFEAPISTSTRQPAYTPSTSQAPASSTVESTHTSHVDADDEELTRFTADLKPAVHDLIREYRGVFPPYFSYSGIPPMRGVEHSIQLMPEYRVHHQAPYRLSIPKAMELKRQLEELLRLGFIKPSNSPWGAPVLFAHKADGTLRLCIDYRGLNRYTVKNSYPMPRADELFDRLAGNRFFTKIDLRSGYQQIRVAAEDQPKTTFRLRFGHYEFTVMPFGLTNIPATFETTMNDIFGDILEEYVLVYLDDILVYSRTLEDHIRHLRDVLQRLRKHGFYAKLSKCRFAQRKVDFLGHHVSDWGLHMDDAKITAIAEWPVPTSVKQLRSFLGLTSYYSNFIQGYASFTTQPIKGETNRVADALSRRPDHNQETIHLAAISITTVDQSVIDAYRTQYCHNPDYRIIHATLRSGKTVPSYSLGENGLVYWHGRFGQLEPRICIPFTGQLRVQAVAEFHDQAVVGHMGFHKTLAHVCRLYVWPKSKDFVKAYIQECPTCQEVNSANHLPYGLLQPLPIPEGRGQSISMDFIGPLRPPTERGHDAISVIVDRFTKRARFVPCRYRISAREVTNIVFDRVVRDHGLP